MCECGLQDPSSVALGRNFAWVVIRSNRRVGSLGVPRLNAFRP